MSKTASISSISKSVSSGITPLRSNEKFWDKPIIPWLKTNQLGEKYIYKTEEKFSEIALEKTSIKLNPVNTLSIAMYGEGKTRGNVSILKTEMATNQACCNVVINAKKADFEYVYYYLKTQYNYLRNLSSGVRKNLNSNDIKNFEIRLPESIATQSKIATVLSTLDKKIALNNRINTELESMAKTLYDYWFVQFDFPISEAQANALGKPELKGKPYKSSGGKMVFNEALKREIPEGWGVGELKKELSVQYGYPFSTKEFTTEITDKPVIRIRDILQNTISLYSTEKVDTKYKIMKGDLLIGMDGNFHINYWDRRGCWLNQRCVRLRELEVSNVSSFQAKFDITPYIKLRERSVSRTTVGHLSAKDIDNLTVLVAPESKGFSHKSIFKSLEEIIISNRVQNRELTQLRDWLLPMLMNGQVTVK